ncbi:homeobox-leucine zipper protein PROTODERMAL FACTOR 2-like isoform X2 [Rutidosis leptorrhynchoides]|uniref:homeobox-leucine zipper protein PROTODERMAL FACTOR 2-like isoform X2 n=1 Tax=Rutidosis leptorrhynchoides TaxID=125765 RepID=UPI003A9951E7
MSGHRFLRHRAGKGVVRHRASLVPNNFISERTAFTVLLIVRSKFSYDLLWPFLKTRKVMVVNCSRWGNHGCVLQCPDLQNFQHLLDTPSHEMGVFVKICRFADRTRKFSRATWIKITGIPPVYASSVSIENIASCFGDVICVSKASTELKQVGFMLVMIETTEAGSVKGFVDGLIEDDSSSQVVKVWVEEVNEFRSVDRVFDGGFEFESLAASNRAILLNVDSGFVDNGVSGGPAAIGEISFDEQRLSIESVHLHEQVNQSIDSKPLLTYHNGTQPAMVSASGSSETDKPVIIEVAVAAMEELVRMAQSGEPLWVQNPDNSSEILNEQYYSQTFSRGIGPKQLGLRAEASREYAVVIINHKNLVEIFMNSQWSNVFSGIVSKAMTIEVISTGVAGNYHGALQVMTAEYQVPSPFVPTREYYFVRYCKQHADGAWAVVDVSLDSLRPTMMMSAPRRRPSGCLIKELPNGYSKVTWVEHVEIDDGSSVHDIYWSLVNSGLGFGAKRWVEKLKRQCERLASTMANNITARDVGVITNLDGRKSMLKLSERMVLSFYSGVGASTTHSWTTLSASGADDVRFMTRKSVDDPGRPPGIILSAAKSFWIPVPRKQVFDFLRNENSRSEWDIISSGGLVQEMMHIANGRDPGNCVSLLRVNSGNSSQGNMLILQECSNDPTGSYVIYAPVDVAAINVVFGGGDPDYVALLPSGFAILPDGNGGGSLLTVGFQILVDSVPTTKLSPGSIATINSLIKCTIERIKAAVAPNNP